jgi:hypothetical protein
VTDVDSALRRLSTGYAAAVDGLDGPRFAALFTGDGELWVPDLREVGALMICRSGTTALERIPSGLAPYRATHHRVGPATYAVEGDSATGEVTGVAHHLAVPGSDPAPVPGGGPGIDTVWYLRYADDYRRTGSEWRIARRVLHLRWIEERPVDHAGPTR